MPCHGIAVQSAQVLVDLEAHFKESAENRQAFDQYLQKQGINTSGWWRTRDGSNTWSIAINTVSDGLKFVGNQIIISDEGSYKRHKQDIDAGYFYAQMYAGLLAQQQTLEAVTALGLEIQNLTYGQNGELSFELNL